MNKLTGKNMENNETSKSPMGSKSTVAPGYVWVFEWALDKYESGYSIESIHTTKRGCFWKMNETANKRWYEDRESALRYGKDFNYPPLYGQLWRMRKVALET